MSSHGQIVLDVEKQMPHSQQVTLKREMTSTWSNKWKISGALLAVALCVAAAVCFTLSKQSDGTAHQTDDIRHTLRQLSGNTKAAIHLAGDYNATVSNTSVEWRDSEDQSFTVGELKLKDNEIHIPHNGYYFVYSQASYRVSCTSSEEDEDEQPTITHLSHQVSRWSGSYDSWKPLLSAVRSACISAPARHELSDPWFSAVYLGAVFNLQAGDRLRTDMDTKLLPDVEADDGKTFFGTFSL